MKNEKLDETPIFNAERSILFLLGFSVVTVVTDYLAWTLLVAINPWGFIAGIPGLLLSFQLLWLFLQPFAIVYENRVEITQSFIHRKQVYFTDVQKLVLKNNQVLVQYNDDEVDKLAMFGIRQSHLPKLVDQLHKQISLVRR